MPPDVSYSIVRSPRAKRLSLRLEPTGELVVTLPLRLAERSVRPFVEANRSWIERQRRRLAQLEHITIDHTGLNAHAKHRLAALKLVREKVTHWNGFYGFHPQRISIKNHSSRWGSCSRLGNLNFSYKLLFLPEELVDYLVVHELCHLEEMNHGPRFWALVARCLPDYAQRRQRLNSIIIR